MSKHRRRRHSAEQVIKKLRDADAMLAAGKNVGEVLQVLEVSEATLLRWRAQYGGMNSEEAMRLKDLETENLRLKKIVADQALDILMLKEITRGNLQPLSCVEPRYACCVRSSRSPSVERVASLNNRDRVSDLRENLKMMTHD
jgi:putative transposase